MYRMPHTACDVLSRQCVQTWLTLVHHQSPKRGGFRERNEHQQGQKCSPNAALGHPSPARCEQPFARDARSTTMYRVKPLSRRATHARGGQQCDPEP